MVYLFLSFTGIGGRDACAAGWGQNSTDVPKRRHAQIYRATQQPASSAAQLSLCVPVCVCVCVLIICMNLMLTAGPDQRRRRQRQRHFGARQAVCLIHKELLMGHTTAPKTKARPQLPSFCQPVHLSTCPIHPFIHLSLYLYIYLSKHRTYLCIYLVIHPCNISPQTVLSFPLFPPSNVAFFIGNSGKKFKSENSEILYNFNLNVFPPMEHFP